MTNYWQSKKVDFGTIKRNTKREFVFQALITIPDIKELRVSCGCTKASYNKELRQMKVTFKAGEIPNHLEGNQKVNQSVTVIYKDGTEDMLVIEGIKTR